MRVRKQPQGLPTAFNENGSEREVVRDRSGSVVSNNLVRKVGVQSHSRGARNGHVGENSHQNLFTIRRCRIRLEMCTYTGDCRDRGGGGNDVALDDTDAEHIIDIQIAGKVVRRGDAHAGSPGIRGNVGIDLVGFGDQQSVFSTARRRNKLTAMI